MMARGSRENVDGPSRQFWDHRRWKSGLSIVIWDCGRWKSGPCLLGCATPPITHPSRPPQFSVLFSTKVYTFVWWRLSFIYCKMVLLVCSCSRTISLLQIGVISCTEEALKLMGKDKEGQGGGVIIATASAVGKHYSIWLIYISLGIWIY